MKRHLVVLCIGSAVALGASSARAQGSSPTKPAAVARPAVPFDAAVRVGTLPNGLRYYLQRHTVPAGRAELRLAVDVGSLMETPAELGVAHFVEHMAFNGSRRFAKLAIQRELEAMGMQFGADLNATTTFDETTYLLSLPTDRPGAVATGVRILADWAGGVTFDSAAVEAERGIIESEWRLRTGAGTNSEFQRMGRVLRAALPGTAYGDRLPIGDPRIIRTVRPSALKAFYRRWYRPSRMAVIVVGDVDVAAVERLVRTELGALAAGPRSAESDRAYPARTVAPRTAPAVIVDVDASVAVPQLSLTYRLPERYEGARASRAELADLIVTRIVGQKRMDSLAQSSTWLNRDYRHVRQWSLSTTSPADVRETIARLVTVPAQVMQHGFTDDEVARARAELLEEQQRNYDRRSAVTSRELADQQQLAFYVDEVVPSPDTLIAVARQELTGPGAITTEEVNAAARTIFGQPGPMLSLALGTNGQQVDRELAQEIADSVRRAPTPVFVASEGSSAAPATSSPGVAASDDRALAARPLIPSPPSPGRIDSVRTIPGIGVTVWHLANGARVVLKRTDFDPEQVLLNAVAPGGLSLAADSEYVDARFSSFVLAASGVGTFSADTLQRKLAADSASSVGLNVSFTDVSTVVGGQASSRHLRTLFELLHLKLTAPRVDTAAISRWQAEARGQLQQRFVQNVIDARRWHFDPRVRPITAEMVDSLDPQRALAFYRARVGDASAFTFYVVGAFDPDSLRPLVERYVASLPSTRAGSRWRDSGIRPPSGPEKIDLYIGTPGQTTISLLYTAPVAWDATSALRIRAVAEIAQKRVQDRLRVRLGATYGVGLNVQSNRVPWSRADVAVNFDSDPQHADSLAQVAIETLESLARTGPTPAEVADAAAHARRELEVALRNNGFWLYTLSMNTWDGVDPATGLVAPDPRIDALTVEALRATATEIFGSARKAIRIFIRPPQ